MTDYKKSVINYDINKLLRSPFLISIKEKWF